MNSEGIYHALRAVDQVAVDMEHTWGVGRLPSLVSPELAAKFGVGKAQLDEAIDADDMERVITKAAMMVRAWGALNAEALKLGAQSIKSLDGAVVHHRHPENGKAYVFTLDKATVHRMPGSGVYSFDEVCRIVDWFSQQSGGVVEEVKKLFPGASVGKVDQDDMDDDIPF